MVCPAGGGGCEVIAWVMPAIGTRVRLKQLTERYQFFIAPKGATGVVHFIGTDTFGRRMDVKMDNCLYAEGDTSDEWDNCIIWQDSSDDFTSGLGDQDENDLAWTDILEVIE